MAIAHDIIKLFTSSLLLFNNFIFYSQTQKSMDNNKIPFFPDPKQARLQRKIQIQQKRNRKNAGTMFSSSL